MSESDRMSRRRAPAGGSTTASRSQATARCVSAKSACTARSVAGSRRIRARSMTAGPRTGTRDSALRIDALAAPDVLLGKPEIVGLVDVKRIGGAHAIAERRVAVQRVAAQHRAANGQYRRAVAGEDGRLVLASQDR